MLKIKSAFRRGFTLLQFLMILMALGIALIAIVMFDKSLDAETTITLHSEGVHARTDHISVGDFIDIVYVRNLAPKFKGVQPGVWCVATIDKNGEGSVLLRGYELISRVPLQMTEHEFTIKAFEADLRNLRFHVYTKNSEEAAMARKLFNLWERELTAQGK